MVSNNSADIEAILTIYSNGASIPYTAVYGGRRTSNNETTVSSHAYITGLGAAQAIEIRWRVNGASTGTIINRSLLVQRVK